MDTIDGTDDLQAFAERSRKLQELLRAAGHRKGDGVSTEGIKLVSRVAKRDGLRDWPDTRTLEDYDRLISAVAAELGGAACEMPPATSAGHVIPAEVAVCPECGGMLELMEDFDVDGDEPPSLSCANESDVDSDEEDYHRFWQSEWQPVGDRVKAYLTKSGAP